MNVKCYNCQLIGVANFVNIEKRTTYCPSISTWQASKWTSLEWELLFWCVPTRAVNIPFPLYFDTEAAAGNNEGIVFGLRNLSWPPWTEYIGLINPENATGDTWHFEFLHHTVCTLNVPFFLDKHIIIMSIL